MSITLIVKRVEGMQLTRYVLDQRQPLILEAPPPGTYFELQNSTGVTIKSFKAQKADDATKLLIADENGVNYEVMLKNISPEEIPPISTTGTNGSYTYALDPSTGIYTLPGFAEEDTLPLDNTSLLLGVGAVALGVLSAGVGLAQRSNH